MNTANTFHCEGATHCSLGGGVKDYTPPAPPKPPALGQAASNAQAQAQGALRRKPQGFQSTILTGGMGDTSVAPGQKKTLLGA